MGKALQIVGGIISLVGAFAGIFVGVLGWYNTVYLDVTAFGGISGYGFEQAIQTDDLQYLLPGVISLLGAIMLLIPARTVALIGGLLVIGGAVFFLVNLEIFSNFDLFWVSSENHIGYGWMMTCAGGLVGIIGAASE